jgi:hypothetical protein
LIDGSYKGLWERITRVASTQAAIMGKTKTAGPCWRFIRLIPIGLILSPASMDL